MLELKIEGVIGKFEALECKVRYKSLAGGVYEVKGFLSPKECLTFEFVLDYIVELLNQVFKLEGSDGSNSLFDVLPANITDRIMYGYHKATDEVKECKSK